MSGCTPCCVGIAGISKEMQDPTVSILTRYDAERIAILGFDARSEASDSSRIDILVRSARPKRLIQIVQIEDEKKSIHTNVDLVTENAVRQASLPSANGGNAVSLDWR